MSSFQINSPNSGIGQCFISFKNTSGSAVAHGDVIVKDLATIQTEIAASDLDDNENGTSTTTAYSDRILGVVYDPQGFGVGDDEVGVLMVRGLHHAVKVPGAVMTCYSTLVANGTALTAGAASAGATFAGTVIGHSINSKDVTSSTTVHAFIDVK